ncbi:MAG: S9 family peptidase, partial [Alphaproteobacteria bacterium]|nr:S9 family peptidase [Alphaproteobacteria bacterium]
IALLLNSKGQSLLSFRDIETYEPLSDSISFGDLNAGSLQWINDQHVIVHTSTTQRVLTVEGMKNLPFNRWVSVSRQDNKTTILFPHDGDYFVPEAGVLLSTLPFEPNFALFSRWAGDSRASPARIRYEKGLILDSAYEAGYSVLKVSLDTGQARRISSGLYNTRDWIVNAAGDPIMRIDNASEGWILRRKHPDLQTFVRIASIDRTPSSAGILNFYSLDETNNDLIATSYADGDTKALVSYDPETGQLRNTIFRNERYGITSVDYNPATARVQSITYTDDFERQHHFLAENRRTLTQLEAALPGSSILISSESTNGQKKLILASYPARPMEYYVYDQATKELSFLSSNRPSFMNETKYTKERFDYTTPDGLTITGYLTLPARNQTTNMPLVVLLHDGSKGRHDKEFHWWSAFYAAKGYAVYEPNPRGSLGLGKRFREAGYGEWGRKIQDDISNGVRHLIAEGRVDATKVCIVGTSYVGGYSALAGATLTPDLYACTVSVNGVSDLASFRGDRGRSGQRIDNWWWRVGDYFKTTKQLEAVSPLKMAGSSIAPIMLIHSKNDPVVPFYHSKKMSKALTAVGKPHEFIELEGADHWLSSGDTRTEMLRRSIEFIDRHIGE